MNGVSGASGRTKTAGRSDLSQCCKRKIFRRPPTRRKVIGTMRCGTRRVGPEAKAGARGPCGGPRRRNALRTRRRPHATRQDAGETLRARLRRARIPQQTLQLHARIIRMTTTMRWSSTSRHHHALYAQALPGGTLSNKASRACRLLLSSPPISISQRARERAPSCGRLSVLIFKKFPKLCY